MAATSSHVEMVEVLVCRLSTLVVASIRSGRAVSFWLIIDALDLLMLFTQVALRSTNYSSISQLLLRYSGVAIQQARD